MAGIVPRVGEVESLNLFVNKIGDWHDLTLRLYKNDKVPAMGDEAAAYDEADFSGYSAISLAGASWTVTPGTPSDAQFAQQVFTSDANQTAQTIYGWYLTRNTTDTLVAAERFNASVLIQNVDDDVRVTPKIEADGS